MDDNLKIKIINEYAEYYDVDLGDCETLREHQEALEEAFEADNELDRTTEVELRIEASFLVGMDASSLSWDDWSDTVNRRITMHVADDGFDRAGELNTVELNDVFDW